MLIPVKHSAKSVQTRCRVSNVLLCRSTWPLPLGCAGVDVTLVTCEAFISSCTISAVKLVALSDCILAGVPCLANHLFKMIFAVVWASYSSCAHGIASAILVKWSIKTSSPFFPDVVLHNFKWSNCTRSLKLLLLILCRG